MVAHTYNLKIGRMTVQNQPRDKVNETTSLSLIQAWWQALVVAAMGKARGRRITKVGLRQI
jgi:hypothetical protein